MMTGGLSCNACNTEFSDEAAQRAHYRSEWHSHNLKRKVAGVPGVTETLFNMRLEALAAEKKSLRTRMIYRCALCDKEYTSSKAHEQHLQSKLHVSKSSSAEDSAAVLRPAPVRVNTELKENKREPPKGFSSKAESESSDEWEEVDGDEEVQSLTDEEKDDAEGEEEEELGNWDPAQCFVCDARPDGTIEGCVEHMHRYHGFFIPDAEYLKDPNGLLSYLGLKVTKGFMCLYCDERGKRFQSLEAVRKHMIAKSHCKLRYGEEEGGADDEVEEFYDFNSSYVGGEIVRMDEENSEVVSLNSGGYELVVKNDKDGDDGEKTIGCREFHRYYKQRPKPVEKRNSVIINAVVARYRSMGLATREPYNVKGRDRKASMGWTRLDVMRSKLGMKNNVIRNLPKNCTH